MPIPEFLRNVRFAARGMAKRSAARAGFELRRVRSVEETRGLGTMEGALANLARAGFAPKVIFDIGANRGDWSILARRHFPRARIVMCEPLAEVGHMLRRCAQRIGDCAVELVAVGAEPGTLSLHVSDDLVGSRLVAHSGSETRSVPVTTLSELAAHHGQPSMVKIDVQGGELSVLEGAGAALGAIDVLIAEVSLFRFHDSDPLFEDIHGALHASGHALYDIAGMTARPRDGALAQLDVCYVRRDSSLRSSQSWE